MNKPKDEALSSKEAKKIVQRGETLAKGSRSGRDRRGEDRGLDAGRRRVDHREVRTAFLARVRDMRLMGMSNSSIAMILNDEGVTTAQGHKWSSIAIQQLLDVAESIDRKKAWTPLGNWVDSSEERESGDE